MCVGRRTKTLNMAAMHGGSLLSAHFGETFAHYVGFTPRVCGHYTEEDAVPERDTF